MAVVDDLKLKILQRRNWITERYNNIKSFQARIEELETEILDYEKALDALSTDWRNEV